MGSWGVKLYQSDVADMVRDDYKNKLRAGKSDEETLEEMLIEYQHERADDEDIFLITDLLLGSCYIPKKNIAYIATGDVRVDAEPDRFETNTCLLRRVKNCGSED